MWDGWWNNDNLPNLAKQVSKAMTEVTVHLAAYTNDTGETTNIDDTTYTGETTNTDETTYTGGNDSNLIDLNQTIRTIE